MKNIFVLNMVIMLLCFSVGLLFTSCSDDDSGESVGTVKVNGNLCEVFSTNGEKTGNYFFCNSFLIETNESYSKYDIHTIWYALDLSKLKPGDVLPTPNVMSQQYGISIIVNWQYVSGNISVIDINTNENFLKLRYNNFSFKRTDVDYTITVDGEVEILYEIFS